MASLDVDQYKKLSDIDHVLQRPGMYVGSTTSQIRDGKCFDSALKKISIKRVQLPGGMEHTNLEVLANAGDNIQRTRESNAKRATEGKGPIDTGVIECVLTDKWFTIKNYGNHIPIARSAEGIWIPELVFGNLRTSSNYDDSQHRTLIGMNGIGAKATNIFSNQFVVECSDPERGVFYKQMWTNNMKTCYQEEITPYRGIGFTKISYSLDFARFGVQGFDQEAKEIFMANCCALSYARQIPVVFNGESIVVPNLIAYAKLFFPLEKGSMISFIDKDRIYDVCLADTPDNGIVVALVNGVVIRDGGVHVDEIFGTIVDHIKELLGKDMEGVSITKRDVVNHVSIFISANLINPDFKGQAKDYLTGLLPLVGPNGQKIARKLPAVVIPDKLLLGMKGWKLIERIYAEIERKQLAQLKKTDGKTKGKLDLDPHIKDAGLAQDKAVNHRRLEATLLVCEGVSAACYLEKFISFVPNGQGRQYYGILPLHGKMLNALNANFLRIAQNRDFITLKKVLGLEEELDYLQPNNFKKLRYGQILVMPDSDNDGKHILGLFLVYFIKRFPSLVQRGYIRFWRTPVVRVTKGGVRYQFYTLQSYLRWKDSTPDFSTWKHKYFKGLGTSTDQQVKDDFLSPKIVRFYVDEQSMQKINLAFLKTGANDRKKWLTQFFESQLPDVEAYVDMPVSHFVDYELINYTVENIIRAIPEAMDGLKESQRKAFFAALKRLKDKKEMKVAQIASAAAEITCYKHGEGSLADAIVLMTYYFVGSNNMAYFSPEGMFGTRMWGGEDAADPRYTYVSLNWWVPEVFRKEDRELEVLVIDEGEERESENFFPILPMHVINGVVGIATGWSSNIACWSPLDVAFWLQCRLCRNINPTDKIYLPLMKPWYKGWTGEIHLKQNGFTSYGRMEILQDRSILITELPVGVWTGKYEEFLNELEKEDKIESVTHYSTDNTVRIHIHGYKDGTPTPAKLKLVKQHSLKNMTVLYRSANRNVRPVIYSDVNVLLEDFFRIRLAKYIERKNMQIKRLTDQMLDLSERARFITLVNEGSIIVLKQPKAVVLAKMDEYQINHKYHKSVTTDEYTVEEVQDLLRKVEEKRVERDTILNTPAEIFWYNELENFITKYCAHEKTRRSTYETTGLPTQDLEMINEAEFDEPMDIHVGATEEGEV